MKSMFKIILLLISISALNSCSKDNETSDNDPSKTFDFFRIKVISDDSNSPDGMIGVFYLGTDSITNCRVTSSGSKDICFAIRKSDKKNLFTVFDDNLYKDNGYSLCSVFLSRMSSLYGSPKAGNYAIFIRLDNGKYPRTWAQFYIDSNKQITVHIPSASDYSETVNSVWTMENYSNN